MVAAMSMLLLYLLAIVSLLVGTAAIYMALIEAFPIRWLYYRRVFGKPIVWTILIGSIAWSLWTAKHSGAFPTAALVPLLLMGLGVLLTYRATQDHVFQAVDFPAFAEDPFSLPLTDDMQVAIVEHDGVTKAYPLDYVVHHHIVNDRFGDRIVALTYCAMCRSIIPFDVSDIGPLYVASFKNANMVVADRKTHTFFQQASFDSMIGKLHPHTLTMIPFQILSWADVKTLSPLPPVARVTEDDLKPFALPVPGVWTKIMASDATPGLSAKHRDDTFPARTRVVGVTDRRYPSEVVYLKEELTNHGIVHNAALHLYLVAAGDTVNAFSDSLAGTSLELSLSSNHTLADALTGTVWDIRGKRIDGALEGDLESIALSDEYWFSWQRFHSPSELIRV